MIQKITIFADKDMLSIINKYRERTGRFHALYPIKLGLLLLNIMLTVIEEKQSLAILDSEGKIIRNVELPK